MTSTRSGPLRSLALLATALAPVVAGATACSAAVLKNGAPPPEPIISWGPGAPDALLEGATDVEGRDRGAAVRVAAGLTGDGGLVVTTWGSSSCPHLPSRVSRDGADVVVETREFTHEGDNGCTSDLRPTSSWLALPEGIPATGPVRVVIDGTAVDAHAP